MFMFLFVYIAGYSYKLSRRRNIINFQYHFLSLENKFATYIVYMLSDLLHKYDAHVIYIKETPSELNCLHIVLDYVL